MISLNFLSFNFLSPMKLIDDIFVFLPLIISINKSKLLLSTLLIFVSIEAKLYPNDE